MLLQKFQDHLKEINFDRNIKLLVAVSGGVDSVVLSDLLFRSDIEYIIAHCNFQLRGEESVRDEQFVRTLAATYNKEVFVERFDTGAYAAQNKRSIQEAARELRYKWFNELVLDKKVAAKITTAHHADDNIETVAMNFFRGTGLKGLTGMSAAKPIFRPLLAFRKQEIVDYAADTKLPFVEDSSNASNKYTRNFFRNELLPFIKAIYPSVEENLLHNINRLMEVEQVYVEAIKQHKARLIELKGEEEHIPILKLRKTHPFKTILWEILKERNFSAHQVDEVTKLMDADNGSCIENELYRIIKNRQWFIITQRQKEAVNNHVIVALEEATKTSFNNKTLLLEKLELHGGFKIPTGATVACLDADKITFPLMLRKWKMGDYFYPLGMKKKKKLSRFFIDQKLSLTDKEKVWVVEMNRKIVWVMGWRIDDRFKIENSTKNILKLTLKVE